MDLFRAAPVAQPLAARLRAASLDEYVGQEHVLGQGKPLREALEQGALHSMIFWGPPGVGKTTLAKLLAQVSDAHFETISAVLSGVKEIRQAVEVAKQQAAQYGRRTILFVDEVHRFNKSQQDAFLPYVEDGTLIFIGATTENPSFELNNALLSRARVYVLKSLDEAAMRKLVARALGEDKGLGKRNLQPAGSELSRSSWPPPMAMAGACSTCWRMPPTWPKDGERDRRRNCCTSLLGDGRRRFDKGGEAFYDQIIRAAQGRCAAPTRMPPCTGWHAMLDGGCDPLYLARRVVRMASEDIGNADPRALSLCLAAWDVQERLGSPEGELAVAQARRSIWPVRRRATRCTWASRRPCARRRSTARWRCRCTCATRRPG